MRDLANNDGRNYVIWKAFSQLPALEWTACFNIIIHMEFKPKPNVIVLQDATNVFNDRVCVDWHHIACVGEIKYSDKDHLKCKAVVALIDASWFALQSTFGQRYVVTFALCGHVLVMCMVDHGGKVTTVEVNMEMNSIIALMCTFSQPFSSWTCYLHLRHYSDEDQRQSNSSYSDCNQGLLANARGAI